MSLSEFTFEPLRSQDLPLLQTWLSRPHVARWWGQAPTLEQVHAEYLPAIEGREPTWHHIALLGERPVAMVQWYLWSSYPEPGEDGDIGIQPGEAGIDYFIGESDLIGSGLGPQLLEQFLLGLVFADPRVTAVRTSVNAENRRSWRALEKIGFERGEPIPHPDGHLQYVPVLRRDQRSTAGHSSL
jgi:aminoglycoside 6'-N-acetyltransferase